MLASLLPIKLSFIGRVLVCASKPVYGRENGFRPGAHADVVRQVHPADCAGGIH